MIILLKSNATSEDLKNAAIDLTDYIKITMDLNKKIVAIGGKYHADSEKILLENGADQINIWGGGVDLITQNFETNAMVNIKPKINPSPEILNEEIRKNFLQIAKSLISL